VTFGSFPLVDRLNPRFVTGRERIKIVVDVDTGPMSAGRTAVDLFDHLRLVLPTLAGHRCGGGSPLARALAPPGPAAGAPFDPTLCAAHLLEHLVIDFQHRIAGMRVCSGVTCGHESPLHRYDIFVETPDRTVGLLAVALARDLMNETLAGASPDPVHRDVIELARHIYHNPAAPITAASAARATGGDGQGAAALAILSAHRFVGELDHSINFSNVPIYRLASHERPDHS